MAFCGSYLWRLRQQVGSELVLMPGAMVVVERVDGRVLFVERTDTGEWCLPAGAAEPGGSFARTAVDELAEEAGIHISAAELIPFGCLSAAEAHTIIYPNGDATHCFALCFLLPRFEGKITLGADEAAAERFAEIDRPPQPLHRPSALALDLLVAFRDGGSFQVA